MILPPRVPFTHIRYDSCKKTWVKVTRLVDPINITILKSSEKYTSVESKYGHDPVYLLSHTYRNALTMGNVL